MGWIIAWRLFTRVAGLASTLILARLLVPEDFGLVAIATGIIATVDALSWLSVHDALVRHPERSKSLYDTGFTLQFLRALLTAALLVVAADPLASFFNDTRLYPIILVLAGGALLSGFENVGTADFRRDLRFDLEFRLQAVPRLIGVIVTIGAAIAWRGHWALITGLLVTRLSRLGASYILSPHRPGWSLHDWRAILNYSLWTWAAEIVEQIRERVDVVAIGRLFGLRSVGVYSVGVEIGALTTTELVEPLHRALFSGFASQQRADEDQTNMFLAALGVALLVVMPVGLGVSIVADPLVRLALGETWLEVVPVIQIVGIGCTVTIFRYISNALQLALGHARLAFWLTVIETAFRVPAIIAGVWYGGVVGAAWGLVVSYAFEQVLAMIVMLPRLRLRVTRLPREVWRPVLGCLAMAGVLSTCGLAWTQAAGGDVWDRWSPSIGQFGGFAKLGSGSPQAANLLFSPLRAVPAA